MAYYLVLLVLLSPATAIAHGANEGPTGMWLHWNLGADVVVPIGIGIGFYVVGLLTLWRRAGVGRGISRGRAAAYGCGILALLVALVSPLEAAAGGLFSAHMVQHLLLILVAPPLLVAGNPDIALLWALPKKSRGTWARIEQRMGNGLTRGKGPLLAILLAVGTLWIWHVPKLYDLSIKNDAVHWAEHAGFLVSALLFWTTVLRLRPADHVDNGPRLLYVFAMALQGSLLGALITFAARPLYQSHLETAPQWGMEPLVDQQLAGLIMWVPPALLYVGVAAYLFVNWLAALESRQREIESERQRAGHVHQRRRVANRNADS